MQITTNSQWTILQITCSYKSQTHLIFHKLYIYIYIYMHIYIHTHTYTHTHKHIYPLHMSRTHRVKDVSFQRSLNEVKTVICCRGRIGLPTFKTTAEFVSVGLKVRKGVKWNFCVEYHTTYRKMHWRLNECSSLRHNFRSKHFLLW